MPMKNDIKLKAKAFLKEHNLADISVNDLKRIIEEQGYTIIGFNHIYNAENVAKLIELLKLEDAISRSRCFTYADEHRRLIFIHEDLSDSEKLLVLAHEEGHIYFNHLSSHPLLGKTVAEEFEANEFAHYILNNTLGAKLRKSIKKHKKLILVASFLIIASAIGLAIFGAVRNARLYYGDYYLTSTGSKYHEKQCVFIKNKNNIRKMTVEEFESGEYEPCNTCLPHGSE